MKTKSFLSLLLALCMSFTLCVPVFALEPEYVEIMVNDEQDIAEFLSSNKFDSHVTYRFIYPDSPLMARINCSKCGYNTLVGKTVEEYDLCHPSSQSMTVQCIDNFFAPDILTVMLVYVYQQCNTCGYKSSKTFAESKFYIECSSHEASYIATDFKTQHHDAAVDWHEWKTSWTVYYNDPHY